MKAHDQFGQTIKSSFHDIRVLSAVFVSADCRRHHD